MAKGQSIGGGGDGSAAASTRRGGMIPPTGAGPVEVTPDWMREQQAGSPPLPAWPLPAPAPAAEGPALASPPAPDTEPATRAGATVGHARVTPEGFVTIGRVIPPEFSNPTDRLAYYVSAARIVQDAAQVNHDRVEHLKVLGLAPILAAMKQEKMWITAGLNSFGELTHAKLGFRKAYANLLLRAYPVALVLTEITNATLKDKQLIALAPVLEEYGEEALRVTWTEATRLNATTANGLKDTARMLGFGPKREIVTERSKGKRVSTTGASAVILSLRSLAETDPARAVVQAESLRRELNELLAEMTDDEENASGEA